MQSTNLPSEQHSLIQFFQRCLLTLSSAEQPRPVITIVRPILSIAKSTLIHNEVLLPHNTKHPPKPEALTRVNMEETRRQDTGTQPSTMPTTPYRVLPKATRAMTQRLHRRAGTKTEE